MLPGHKHYAKVTPEITVPVAPPIANAAGFCGSGVFALVGLTRTRAKP